MNASKLLISSTAALAVVGALSLANAQSTDSTTSPATTNQQMNNQSGVQPAPEQAGTTAGQMNNTTTSSDIPADLAAQADRN